MIAAANVSSLKLCACRAAGGALLAPGPPRWLLDRMARWALGAILANAQEPELPIELPGLGFAPLEDLDAVLAGAAAPQLLPAGVQAAIDRQAWQEASECQRHYYERRRRDLMARHP